ncbi:MAG TPA: tetratricopeptide repeat protein [Candidatus Limnocylindria bacterium]|nr:tetratricopeptide repeat protein [Candidatus Limnocylindria bacterium]
MTRGRLNTATAITVTSATSLGERIRAARRERGLSQSALAGEELTKGFISQVEAGLVRPSLRSLQLIASRLDKSLDYFLGDEPLTSTKRVAFHQLAAQTAAERGDWDAVRTEVNTALEHAREPRERARLASLLAGSDIAAGDHEAAFARITDALAVLDPASDALDVAYLLYRRGVAYAQIGQMVAASEAFEASRRTVEQYEISDPRLRARLLVNLGTTYRRLNRTTKALATYESALTVATHSSELEMAARSYMGLAASLADSGEFDAAIANYQRALSLWERLSDASLELGVLHSLAEAHFEAGDIAKARLMAERCLARSEALGDDREAAVARTELARVAIADGRFDEALAMARSADHALATMGDDRQRASALRVMGAALHARGEHAASDEAYTLAIDLVTRIDHFADRSQIAAEYAKKLRERGDLDRAFDMLELARGPVSKR